MSAIRSSIGEALRGLVAIRPNRLCEYCLIHEDDTFFGCEVDHIISLKHGGKKEEDNLAFACLPCNRHKGSDIGSIVADSGQFIRLFNPREDRWSDHFRLEGAFCKSPFHPLRHAQDRLRYLRANGLLQL